MTFRYGWIRSRVGMRLYWCIVYLNGKKGNKRDDIITFYDMPSSLPGKKVKKEEKKENEYLRRWKVVIDKIDITSIQSETFNPFIQFIIGGDYRIEYTKTTTGKLLKSEVGNIGSVFKSNVIFDLMQGGTKKFTKDIYTEIEASYYQIMQNKLHIEIWNYGSYKLNTF